LALLNFLAASLDPGELPQATVVFDAHEAPRGLPRWSTIGHHGAVCRAVRVGRRSDRGADPRRLGLRGAWWSYRATTGNPSAPLERRKAEAVDSDVWYAELIRARRQRRRFPTDAPARPAVPLLEEDVNYWLRQFGGESALAEFLAREKRRSTERAGSRSRQPANACRARV